MQWNVRCWRDDDIDAEDKVDEVTSNVGIVVVALKYISMNVRVCKIYFRIYYIKKVNMLLFCYGDGCSNGAE